MPCDSALRLLRFFFPPKGQVRCGQEGQLHIQGPLSSREDEAPALPRCEWSLANPCRQQRPRGGGGRQTGFDERARARPLSLPPRPLLGSPLRERGKGWGQRRAAAHATGRLIPAVAEVLLDSRCSLANIRLHVTRTHSQRCLPGEPGRLPLARPCPGHTPPPQTSSSASK